MQKNMNKFHSLLMQILYSASIQKLCKRAYKRERPVLTNGMLEKDHAGNGSSVSLTKEGDSVRSNSMELSI